jgi:murein DD-endopeptidase MepM/ murein hydrolase activator NlpD
MTAIGEHGARRRDRALRTAGRVLAAAAVLLVAVVGSGAPADAAAAAWSPVVTASPSSGAASSAGPVRAIAADAGEDAPGYPWAWPVGGQRVVIAPFRAPAHDYGPGHRGMDVAAEPVSEVGAPADGVVAFRGTVVHRPLITIDHGHGYVTTLEPVNSDLSPGDAVSTGDRVGVLAGGGHAPRGTLHIGVRVDDVYVNPRGLFGRPPRAVLLPCCES